MDKLKVLSTLIIGAAVVLAAMFLGNAYKDKNRINDTIEVTGLGKKDFEADMIVWSGSFSRRSMEMKDAYADLERDRKRITAYLSSQAVQPDEMVFEAIDIQQQYDYWYDEDGRSHKEFKGYQLTQVVKVEAQNDSEQNRVDIVESLARNVTELINEGIEFYSHSPLYYYSGLEELKIEMVASATENASERAEQIAENSGSSLGELKSARMGVFQIIARNANEEYSWGGTYNTSSRYKTAQITMKLKFAIN